MENSLKNNLTLGTISAMLKEYEEYISPSDNFGITVNIYSDESCDLFLHDLIDAKDARILKFKNAWELFVGLTGLLVKEASNTEIRGETILDFIPISDINTTEYRVDIDTFLLDTITPA